MIDDFIVKMGEIVGEDLPPLEIEKLNNNIIKVKVNKDVSFEDFINQIKSYINDNFIKSEFLLSNNLLDRGSKLILINNNDVALILSCALSLSSKFYIYFNNQNREITLKSEKQMWGNNISFQYYEKDLVTEKEYKAKLDIKGFLGNIEYKRALNLVRNLIDYLDKTNIDEYFSLGLLKHSLNFARTSNVVKSDELISLSWDKEENDSINEVDRASFEIVLNETQEVVGNIAFDFKKSENEFYFGNVSYDVFPVYQNNGYATRALKLLKDLVKTNTCEDKNLYISTVKSNKISQKVALNCGGELYFSGVIPDDVVFWEEERNINIYKIKI